MAKRYRVEYLEDGHIYLVNGVIVPSVTQLVSYALGGNTYSNIPKRILDAKAQYGTEVHQLIQDYEEKKITLEEVNAKRIDPNQKSALNQYVKLKSKYLIYPKNQEVIVNYKDKMAGRYDMLDCDDYLWDIKTTQKVHTDALEWQLGLYYLALGKPKDIGYCIWLPKSDVGQVIQITPKSFKECEEMIEQYEINIPER